MKAPLALATSSNARELSTEDDLLLDALTVLGVKTHYVNWDDPDYDWVKAGLVLVRTTWDYHCRLAEFRAWLERIEGEVQVLNPPRLLRWNSDKRYLFDLEAKGIPIVPTLLLPAAAAAQGVEGTDRWVPLIAAQGWRTIVVKPAVAAGAYETLVYDVNPDSLGDANWQPVLEHFDRLTGHSDILVQPYIDAITREGETSLVFFDGEFHHAVTKVPREGDFRVQSEFGGAYTVVDPTPAQQEIGFACMRSVPELPLYARADVVNGVAGPMLMELELIEPELFLLYVENAALEYADLLREKLAEAILL